jgi:hypothetical protein
MSQIAFKLTTDDIWPRDDENRFRLYTLLGSDLEIVASAPDLESIGVAFGMLLGEGQFEKDSTIGVLDTGEGPAGRKPFHRGTWLLNPYPTRALTAPAA